MKKSIKISSIFLSFTLTFVLLILNITSVYAWFNGQGYVGKTMSYYRSLYIGSANAEVTNYYGYVDSNDNFIYVLINPLVGFERNSLIPGNFVHLKTEINNQSTTADMYISLYLQNIVYDEPLHNYLYFGTNDPIINKETFKSLATYNAQVNRYILRSIPLMTNYVIPANTTLSLYWYLYIDSDAGNEIANSFIDLGLVTLVYN